MLEALGREASEARRERGVTQLDVATSARVSTAVVSRFENGLRWPEEVERVIAAYAQETGVRTDELWERGLKRLRANGLPPKENDP